MSSKAQEHEGRANWSNQAATTRRQAACLLQMLDEALGGQDVHALRIVLDIKGHRMSGLLKGMAVGS